MTGLQIRIRVAALRVAIVGLIAGLPAMVVPGIVNGQTDRFEGPPIVDFPLITPQSSEVVPAKTGASPANVDDAPSSLPVTKETLDTAIERKRREALPEGPNFSGEPTRAGSNSDSNPTHNANPHNDLASPGKVPLLPSETSRPTTAGILPAPSDENGISKFDFEPQESHGIGTSWDERENASRTLDDWNSTRGDVVLPQEGPYQAYPEATWDGNGNELSEGGAGSGERLWLSGLLPDNMRSDGGGWDIGGWLSGGVTVNANGNDTSTGNAPLGFNNAADGFVVNQAWLYIGKETQTHGFGWDWGFRLDVLFGADAPDTQAFRDGSWDESWDTGGEYGFAIPQMYAEVAYNRTKTKFGRFFTNIGYEQVAAPYNFFYSHSLSRYYNQPFTHTGFLTQFDLRPDVILFGGWTAGWDAGFDNRHNGSAFLGGAVWHASDRWDLMYATSAGDPGDARSRGSNVYMHSIISDVKFGYGWNYVVEWDYQRLKSGGSSTTSNGLNQYLFKQVAHDATIGARFEYFRDGDGVRIGQGKGNYYGFTLGGNWRPVSQMVLRPEIRWDWFEGQGRPYNDNHSRSQFTFGIDAVYVF